MNGYGREEVDTLMQVYSVLRDAVIDTPDGESSITNLAKSKSYMDMVVPAIVDPDKAATLITILFGLLAVEMDARAEFDTDVLIARIQTDSANLLTMG